MDNGPQIELSYYMDGTLWHKQYVLDGQWHRTDGPACTEYCRGGRPMNVSYFINGEELSKSEIADINKKLEIDKEIREMISG